MMRLICTRGYPLPEVVVLKLPAVNKLQLGVGVYVGVLVRVTVDVTVGVFVGVEVAVDVGVVVTVGVSVGNGVFVTVGVFDGVNVKAGTSQPSGVLMARTARKDSTYPMRYDAR